MPECAPIPILVYHAVDDDPPAWIARFSVTPKVFARHLDLLAEARRTPLTVSALADALAAGELPERPAVITFDDGLADVLAAVAPLLAERGVPATLFATSGFVGLAPAARPPGRWLDAAGLAAVREAGIEVGAHSRTHPELDTISPERARDEVRGSRDDLEDALGVPVRTFAYPHGYSSRRVRTLVQEAGFAAACGVGNLLSSPADDRFALARLMPERTTTDGEVRAWLDGRGAPVAPRRVRARTVAWRGARRARRKLRDLRGPA